MPLKLSQSFSFFGGGNSSSYDDREADGSGGRGRPPELRLRTDREVYRPGDPITATIEVCSPSDGAATFMLDSMSFEIKGIEKLDTQWFATQKPLAGSKEKRGERIFLDCTTSSITSKIMISSGSSKAYLVRAEIPKTLPPSYRGTAIRYMYYVKSTVCGRWLVLENGHCDRESGNNLIQLEGRHPLQIWGAQKCSSVLSEEKSQTDGNSSALTAQIDVYWKEKNVDSEWVRAIETVDGFEEGYDSSRDEISSVSSYNPTKGNLELALRNSLSLQSIASRPYYVEGRQSQGEPSHLNSYMTLSQLSVAEVTDDADMAVPPLSHRRKFSVSPFSKDETRAFQGSMEPVASEGFIRGRSYNIRIDDQVLLRFSPKNSDSTYYYGDVIGGNLTFFHGGARRCLEVSITLEISETITQHFVHPSRRSSPTISKVQSDYHAVVADLGETNFLFSIPMDGPMSFSTPHVSVQWALRFEFFTNPNSVDWRRYEHPLLIEDREKGDWVLPITVHAPPRHTKNQKPSSLGSLWVQT
uniref:Retrograde Golgi transport protein RGP1 n=1 Tax=Anthurium amnicola TaxID=1678845 RepID=A0A1D1XLL4_9ARAE